MARDWRRSTMAAVAAAVLWGVCVPGAPAPAAAEEPSKTGRKRQDPAEAQRAIEAALKQVQAGRAEQAVRGLTATLSAGNLPPAILARALYVRGMAYRQQGRSAQAISDLNSALWLKGGLGGDDRADASKERAAAYADAGLGERRDAGRKAAPTASGSWLSGLFGAPDPPARRPAVAPPPAKATAAAPGGWAGTTEVQPSRAELTAAAPRPRAEAAPRAEAPRARSEPLPARLEGHYQVQLAAVRTEAEARALAAKAKREGALARLEAAIDRAVLGNMGTFYRVRFGPFASVQETQAVCAKLQGSGFDCMPVGP